ncbi:hypothetical protein AAZX31_19G188100 [Glycine max]
MEEDDLHPLKQNLKNCTDISSVNTNLILRNQNKRNWEENRVADVLVAYSHQISIDLAMFLSPPMMCIELL